jgi:hypothetical protein
MKKINQAIKQFKQFKQSIQSNPIQTHVTSRLSLNTMRLKTHAREIVFPARDPDQSNQINFGELR